MHITDQNEVNNELAELFQDQPSSESLTLVMPEQVSPSRQSNTEWDKARLEDKNRAWAKFRIVKAFIQYRMEHKANGIGKNISGPNFVKLLLRGEVCREEMNLLKVGEIAFPTLRRWEKKLCDSGNMDSPVSMLESFRFCGRKSQIDAYLRNTIRQLAVDERNLNPNWIYLFLSDQLELTEQVLPFSVRHLQRMVRAYRKEVFTVSLSKGKETLKNKVKLHTPRINDLLPGELFESDGHRCNILVKSPFYYHRNPSYRYLVRPTIVAWIDVGTSLIVGYRVCLNENKTAIRNSLMDAISRFGIPDKIRMDNGGAYRNVEYSPLEFYKEHKGKKLLTADEKIAKQMIESGNKGLYLNLGIEPHFTIPGNPEGKSIEAFWDYCIAPFEKSFPSWVGNNFQNRPDIFKNLDNKTLARKYGDKFPTWQEFTDRLDKYIQYYNSKQRVSLTTIEGEKLSPLEAYNQIEHIIPSQLEIQSKMRDPYIETRIVQRSMIEKNGILYWHSIFASMIGQKVGIYYDEKDICEITICNERGQIYEEKAIAIDPGLQSGDNLNSLIEVNKMNKIGKLCYLSLCDITGAMKIEKMLGMISREILPLSNTKQLENDDIKYMSFDEALDSVLWTAVEVLEEDDSSACEISLSEDEKQLRDEIKKDIEGMF